MNPQISNEAVIVDTSHSPYARLKPVSMNNIALDKGFWESRVNSNQTATLNSQYALLESTGRLDNFRRVIDEIDRPFRGYVFNDSDVYKWLEAASWAMVSRRDEHLQEMIDQIVNLIIKAQDKNGYVNTYFSLERTSERWTNLLEKHELYCAGHLIQAAIAHRRATGESRLLEAAIHLADHIYSQFGPSGREGTSGHPEIEMALVELYRITGDKKYLELAATFINRRGHHILDGSEYLIDHKPFRELEYLAGHAVRALYLCTGAADLFLETGEPQIKTALQRLWTNMVSQQMYITGGLGARHEGEAFGQPYELPNDRAYAETCAAIASVMWNWRMLQIDGDARYADLVEWTYLNAILPGISLDGKEYFYTNPLRDNGDHRREKWFECACCPPNISRAITEFSGYIYSVSNGGVWVHQYASSKAMIEVQPGRQVELAQSTRYPWDGSVILRIANLILNQKAGEDNAGEEFSLFLRVPGWVADQRALIKVNDEIINNKSGSGSYIEIQRNWQIGDTLTVDFPMEVRYIESHPLVDTNIGRIAITRGPLVYCLETADNPNVILSEILINLGRHPQVEFLPDLLEGITQLRFLVEKRSIEAKWNKKLYLPYRELSDNAMVDANEVISIPYYAWANRTPGAMEIWHTHS